MYREDYLPDRNGITAVKVALTRDDDSRLIVRLVWTQNGVENWAEVTHRLGMPVAAALTHARNAVWQIEYWHTTLADVFATLAGEDRGLSVE